MPAHFLIVFEEKKGEAASERLLCVRASSTLRRRRKTPVIPPALSDSCEENAVPRFFFPAAVWRARDGKRDLLSAEQGNL